MEAHSIMLVPSRLLSYDQIWFLHLSYDINWIDVFEYYEYLDSV